MSSTAELLPTATGKNAWSQVDQLLTCAICLDRYRNPKLLPCQHTFCMDPCLEGLIDYIRKQIKCPECRAEHRIPYQGIQGYPTNVTLMRFLEVHFEVTGETPDLTPSIKERCGVCSEKGYLNYCGHCDKRVCPDCKNAHMDILRREIGRINSQVRRGLHRLQDALSQAEKSVDQLPKDCANVMQEIEEIFRRLQKALKDREETLKSDVQTLLQTELRNLTQLKDNLEVEVNNIQSNCELIEKHVNDTNDWEDIELVDYKETFLKTLDFVRNFDPDQTECLSRLRLQAGTEPEMLLQTIAHLGDLTFNCSQLATVSPVNNLMRSKSDHRLATQFHREEQQRGYLGVGQRYSGHSSDTETPSYRRSVPERGHDDSDRFGSRRFGGSWQREDDAYRSRFARDDFLAEGGDLERAVRFNRNDQTDAPPPKRLFESEDAIRGPLSGIGRLLDSPVVVRRIQQNEMKSKQDSEQKVNRPPPQVSQVPVLTQPARTTQRQVSEDDEIAKAKAEQSVKKRSGSRQDEPEAVRNAGSSRGTSRQNSRDAEFKTPPSTPCRRMSVDSSRSDGTEQEVSGARRIFSRQASEVARMPSKTPSISESRKSREDSDDETMSRRRWLGSNSAADEASSSSSSESTSESPERNSQPLQASKPLTPSTADNSRSPRQLSSSQKQPSNAAKPKFVSRFLPRQSSERNKSSGESDSDSDDVAEEAARDAAIYALLARSAIARRESVGSGTATPANTPATRPAAAYATRGSDDALSSDRYGSLASRYPLSRRSSSHMLDEDEKYESPSRYLSRSKSSAALGTSAVFGSLELNTDFDPNRYRIEPKVTTARGNQLGRCKSSYDIALKDDEDDDFSYSPVSSYRRFDPYPDLSRSHSNHAISLEQNPDEGPSASAITSWAKYLKQKYGNRRETSRGPSQTRSELSEEENTVRGSFNLNTRCTKSPRTGYLQKNKVVMKIGKRGTEPGNFTWPRGVAVGPDNSIVVADSGNHRIQIFDSSGRFIKEFGSYGNGDGEFDCLAGVTVNRLGQYIVSDRYNHRIQVFDSSGNFLRSFGNQGVSDGKLSYPWGIGTDSLGFIYVCDKENHRVQVFQTDGTFVGKFGGLGNKLGQLEHPHYIAMSNSNKVVVSDSNNHRVQIFDVNGKILTSFGEEGSDDGQFKYPRGVAVDDVGYIIVGDSGNNRIQVFSSEGVFLRAFGTWGSDDGEFKGLEGVAVASNGNILVCDRENHRIQIF